MNTSAAGAILVLLVIGVALFLVHDAGQPEFLRFR